MRTVGFEPTTSGSGAEQRTAQLPAGIKEDPQELLPVFATLGFPSESLARSRRTRYKKEATDSENREIRDFGQEKT